MAVWLVTLPVGLLGEDRATILMFDWRRMVVIIASGSTSNRAVRGACTTVTRARDAPRLGCGSDGGQVITASPGSRNACSKRSVSSAGPAPATILSGEKPVYSLRLARRSVQTGSAGRWYWSCEARMSCTFREHPYGFSSLFSRIGRLGAFVL